MGTQVYRHPPRYLAGHGCLLAFFMLAMAATAVNWWWMRRENGRRDANTEEEGKGEDELLDWHPSFRYIL